MVKCCVNKHWKELQYGKMLCKQTLKRITMVKCCAYKHWKELQW